MSMPTPNNRCFSHPVQPHSLYHHNRCRPPLPTPQRLCHIGPSLNPPTHALADPKRDRPGNARCVATYSAWSGNAEAMPTCRLVQAMLRIALPLKPWQHRCVRGRPFLQSSSTTARPPCASGPSCLRASSTPRPSHWTSSRTPTTCRRAPSSSRRPPRPADSTG